MILEESPIDTPGHQKFRCVLEQIKAETLLGANMTELKLSCLGQIMRSNGVFGKDSSAGKNRRR